MTVVSSSGDRLGEQNPAYRPSLALLFLFSRFRDARSGRLPHAQRSACHGAKRGQKGHQQGQTGGVGTSLAGGPRVVAFALQAKMHVRVLHDLQGPTVDPDRATHSRIGRLAAARHPAVLRGNSAPTAADLFE